MPWWWAVGAKKGKGVILKNETISKEVVNLDPRPASCCGEAVATRLFCSITAYLGCSFHPVDICSYLVLDLSSGSAFAKRAGVGP